jgi:hypothetical protein
MWLRPCVCVCVCVSERERESVCVCECVSECVSECVRGFAHRCRSQHPSWKRFAALFCSYGVNTASPHTGGRQARPNLSDNLGALRQRVAVVLHFHSAVTVVSSPADPQA